MGDFIVALTVAAAAIKMNKQETEERHRQWEEERKRQEEERRIAEEHKRRAELVTELIENWEEAARVRRFVKAIEEETVRSAFSELQKNDIQQVADWTRDYADSLDPLCDLLEAIEEFVLRANTGGWSEFALTAQHLSGFESICPVFLVVHY
jgi:hypothetical protein